MHFWTICAAKWLFIAAGGTKFSMCVQVWDFLFQCIGFWGKRIESPANIITLKNVCGPSVKMCMCGNGNKIEFMWLYETIFDMQAD